MTDLSALSWQPADRAKVDRATDYLVETNDGALEVWDGTRLYLRMRPEFQIGRAVRVAEIDWNEWERVQ